MIRINLQKPTPKALSCIILDVYSVKNLVEKLPALVNKNNVVFAEDTTKVSHSKNTVLLNQPFSDELEPTSYYLSSKYISSIFPNIIIPIYPSICLLGCHKLVGFFRTS